MYISSFFLKKPQYFDIDLSQFMMIYWRMFWFFYSADFLSSSTAVVS